MYSLYKDDYSCLHVFWTFKMSPIFSTGWITGSPEVWYLPSYAQTPSFQPPSHNSLPRELPFLLMIGSVIFLSAFLFHSCLPYIPVLSPFCFSLLLSLNKGWSKVGRIRLFLGICLPQSFSSDWCSIDLATSSAAHSSCHSPFQN